MTSQNTRAPAPIPGGDRPARAARRDEEQAHRFFERGIQVKAATSIMRSPQELFEVWRRFDQLPRFIDHLESVETTGPNTTRWTTKGPGGRYSWDAEIIAEEQGPTGWRIAWRSVGETPIDNAGTIRFRELPGGPPPGPDARGTEVHVTIEYVPPGGKLGDMLAKFSGDDAKTQVKEALHRFRQVMETGEVTTAAGKKGQGQSAGENPTRKDRYGESEIRTDRDVRDIAGRNTPPEDLTSPPREKGARDDEHVSSQSTNVHDLSPQVSPRGTESEKGGPR